MTDPSAQFEQLHNNTVTAIEAANAETIRSLGDALSKRLALYTIIITQQSAELSLFRSLEVHIRNQSLTEDILNATLSKLDEARKLFTAQREERNRK